MTNQKQKKIRPKPAGRVPLSLRVTPDVRNALNASSEKLGRSISQEAEFRLEESFRNEGLLAQALLLRYGPTTAGFLLLIGEMMRAIALWGGPKNETGAADWTESAGGNSAVREGVNRILDELKPSGQTLTETVAAAYLNMGNHCADLAMKNTGSFVQMAAEQGGNHLLANLLKQAQATSEKRGKRK